VLKYVDLLARVVSAINRITYPVGRDMLNYPTWDVT